MARIGVDLDGVCYGFSEAFCELLGWEHRADRWEFYKDFGMVTEEFLKQCRQFIFQGKLFRTGHLLPGTKEAFDLLRSEGHTIHIVTDRQSLVPDDGYAKEAIRKSTDHWLEVNDLRYETLVFDGNKAKVAKELELDYFIDDKLENHLALEGVVKGNYLLDRPWNQAAVAEAYSVQSWEQFVGMVRLGEFAKAKLAYNSAALRYEGAPVILPTLPAEVRITSATGGEKGQKLAREGSLDPKALTTVAEVAGFGEQKYARLNYMNGYDWSLSYDACQRHLKRFWSGQDLDDESGLPHLAHAAWHCLAMLAFLEHGIGTDDRFVKPATFGECE